ncbi:MAG: D-glycero-beta-D-manno-heptose 1,7-bisphosphate 7-phosphatase [Bacteroidetes bacterium]|nr:D-glycero-beta-D-manno-heptose 1,7-bisphosphate 7-phosphatase [Bacteroidota bacterium]
MRQAVFLDRDGTINEDCGYLGDPKQVRILPGVTEALTLLKEHRWLLVVVSNQSGIGRGYYGKDDLRAVREVIEMQLSAQGLTLDGAYFCPHAPDEKCACRKPEPGLLLQAADDLDIDLKRSWMIGDKFSDVEAGKRAGCRAVLVDTNQIAGAQQDVPANVVLKPDLLSAARYILDA